MYGHWSLCSSCISGQPMIERDFLKYLEFLSLLAFAKDFVILGGHTFNTQNGSLQFCLDFHFLFMWHLKVSQSESLGFSQIFLEHVHSPTYSCICPSRLSGMVRSVQSLLWTCHSSIFPSKLFGQILVCSNSYHCLRQWQC